MQEVGSLGQILTGVIERLIGQRYSERRSPLSLNEEHVKNEHETC